MPRVEYERDGRIGRITLKCPQLLNAIDDDLPLEQVDALASADSDSGVHVMLLSGAGKAFCSGYHLAHYAAIEGAKRVIQEIPWDLMQDFQLVWRNTPAFTQTLRVMKPLL